MKFKFIHVKIFISRKKWQIVLCTLIFALFMCLYSQEQFLMLNTNLMLLKRYTLPEAPKIRLLCWVLSDAKTLIPKSVAVKETWGKRCDKLVFISTIEDKELGAVKMNISEEKNMIWGKTRLALKYFYDHFLKDYDWYFKADDDTYVIVENLRYMLQLYDPDFPMALGMRAHRLYGNINYLSGGPGYAISRAGIKSFAEKAFPNPKICRSTPNSFGEDMELGRCLINADILLGDSRDEFGKYRFFHHLPQDVISGKHQNWYPKFLKYPYGKGLDIFSATSITFHKLKDTNLLYVLEYFIYQLQIFGLNREFAGAPLPALPPDANAIPQEVLERFGHPNLNSTSGTTLLNQIQTE